MKMGASIVMVMFVFFRSVEVIVAQSWTPTIAPLQNWFAIASSADGNRLFAGANFSGIYASTDSGETWTKTSAPDANWQSIACSTDGEKLVAAAGYFANGLIYTSTNAGVTWTPTTAPYTNWHCVASSADGNRLAAVVFEGLIYVSTNSGATWQETTAPKTNWVSIASSADGATLAAAVGYVVTQSPTFISTNYGVTWVASAPPYQSWSSIACSADGKKVVASGGHGIYTSTNSGFDWAMPSIVGDHVACSADGGTIIAASYVGPIYISTNSGGAWTATDAPDKAWISITSSADGSKLAAADNGNLIYVWPSVPKLKINQLGTNISILWPSNSGSTGFVLQKNPYPGMTNWADVGAVVNNDGTNEWVTLFRSTTNFFFRLKK